MNFHVHFYFRYISQIFAIIFVLLTQIICLDVSITSSGLSSTLYSTPEFASNSYQNDVDTRTLTDLVYTSESGFIHYEMSPDDLQENFEKIWVISPPCEQHSVFSIDIRI
jgi:hypothetical protein